MDRDAHIRLSSSGRTHVRVAETGVLARRALRSGRFGRVAAVFERSLYARFDDDWICIGAATIGSGPLHVLCDDFAAVRMSVGQQIAVTDKALLMDETELTGLDVAAVWSPPNAPAWTFETLQAGLLEVDRAWQVSPAEEGLAAAGCLNLPSPPSQVVAAAGPGLAALGRWIEDGVGRRGTVTHDGTAIVDLIGLGPGLTPSGDDLLGGALLALASLGYSDARDALWAACRIHLDRTNDISAAHLRSAACGCAASVLHEALFATISGRLERIAPALTALSRVGHSSGRDAFAGALMVLRSVDTWMRSGNAAVQQAAA